MSADVMLNWHDQLLTALHTHYKPAKTLSQLTLRVQYPPPKEISLPSAPVPPSPEQ
jgi:hypothetical protein